MTSAPAEASDAEEDYEEDFQDDESPKPSKKDDFSYKNNISSISNKKSNRFETPGQLDVSPPKMSNFSIHTAKK